MYHKNQFGLDLRIEIQFYHPKWDGIQWIEGGTIPKALQAILTESERITALGNEMLFGGTTNVQLFNIYV